MEVLINIISTILFISLIIVPYIIYKLFKTRRIKYPFLIYFTFSMITSFIIIIIFGWWLNISDEYLLSKYGYNIDVMNEFERFKNVDLKNLEQVKTIEISQFGIGWPLKALFSFIYYLPFLLLICFYFHKKKLNKKSYPTF